MEEEGKGIGCLMDIPESKASTLGCFCFIARSLEFMFFGWLGSLGMMTFSGKLVEEKIEN